MREGGWIFISHSHQDIETVRRIRNHLESLGFEPLMFFLKCLSDNDEIEGLIKREIDERDWFIYVDSPNARASKWVRTEREYIETLSGKKVFTIDLNANVESQLEQIEHIAKQMKVYISYSHKDRELQMMIKQKLIERDMLVLTDMDVIEPGALWAESITKAVKQASRDGFVLILITEQSQKSQHILHEIDYAHQSGGKIIPVLVGDVKLSAEMMYYLGDAVSIRISEKPSDEELEKIVTGILKLVSYSTDFKNTYGYRSAKTIHLPEISRIDNMTFFECECLECVYIPDSVIYITADAFEDHPNILIKCSKNSYAEQYCKKMGMKYELIEN